MKDAPMNKADAPHRWYHPWRAASSAREVDAADLGTAFGLEVSLEEMSALESASAPSPLRKPSWIPRWATRGKASD